MKEIQLTQGKFAIVDDEDFERLNRYKWYARYDGWNWYVGRNSSYLNGKRKEIKMHRVVVGAVGSIKVDHISGNGFDNRKENLRTCTHGENMYNKRHPYRNNKLGIKGVCWRKDMKKFTSSIQIGKKLIHLGSFEKADDADIAYRHAEVKYFGEFARESSKLYVKILSPEYQMSLAG